MVDYSKWDKMVKDIESMDSEEVAKNVKCEIGKPLTEEEFKKMKESERQTVVPVSSSGVNINTQQLSKAHKKNGN